MIEPIKKIAILLLLVIGISSCSENNYVEYKPHYLSENNEHKYYGESELDTLELKNIIQVLEYQGEDYKVQGNVIMISKELSENWELVWNYTTKANDVDWLVSHH